MNKYIILLLSLVPLYAISDSFDLPTVQSTKVENHCEISFNHKVVSKHDCEYESPSYLTSYSLLPDSWTGVWVFQDAPMGNSCEAGTIRVISMDADGNIKTYNPIDYCSGKILIENGREQVKIMIYNEVGEKNYNAWVFKDNNLINQK